MFQDFNRSGVCVGNGRCRLNVGQGGQPYLVDLRLFAVYTCSESFSSAASAARDKE